jgi:membrane peptidoglycan carboxypeptidase
MAVPAHTVDFHRVMKRLRHPGSTMTPIVYLAAVRTNTVTLDTASELLDEESLMENALSPFQA